MTKSMSEMMNNEECVIKALEGDNLSCERLIQLGFLPGALVTLISKLPFNGPLALSISGTKVAIRLADAAQIVVQTA
ncbi:ferrous iron transport protein A [bacterium]|jgi:Fe2+ transport system protein FeoA|nr:ferrous iron transport protein A [bacterium]